MNKFSKHISLILLASFFALSVSSQTYCNPQIWIGGSLAHIIQSVKVDSIHNIPYGASSTWDYTHMKAYIKAGDTILMVVTIGGTSPTITLYSKISL